jgi:nucleoside-diphosphate-sugar epimerase
MRILQSNIIGTATLLQACLKTGFEAFVNTGSSSEYGFKDHPPGEKEWLEPNSYYAVAKASATLFCRYTAQSLGLRIPTLRLYSVYGPYEEPSRLMPTLIVKGLENRLPPLVAPHIARDYVYVDDVVRAYLLAATEEEQELGAVYNVGTGVQTSLREVVDIACCTLGIAEEPKWGSMDNRIWDTATWVSDNRLVRQGWHPEYIRQDFENGECSDNPARVKSTESE